MSYEPGARAPAVRRPAFRIESRRLRRRPELAPRAHRPAARRPGVRAERKPAEAGRYAAALGGGTAGPHADRLGRAEHRRGDRGPVRHAPAGHDRGVGAAGEVRRAAHQPGRRGPEDRVRPLPPRRAGRPARPAPPGPGAGTAGRVRGRPGRRNPPGRPRPAGRRAGRQARRRGGGRAEGPGDRRVPAGPGRAGAVRHGPERLRAGRRRRRPAVRHRHLQGRAGHPPRGPDAPPGGTVAGSRRDAGGVRAALRVAADGQQRVDPRRVAGAGGTAR